MREDREETPESVAQLLRKLEALGYIEVIGGMARMLRDIDA
jgi:Mn-dependent DtxR family transcriptional regulator